MSKTKVTKLRLLDNIYDDSDIEEYKLSRDEVALVTNKFLEKLKAAILELDHEERIELRGFGTFGVKVRKSHVARNPKTGEKVDVPRRRVLYFKPGRDMKTAVKK